MFWFCVLNLVVILVCSAITWHMIAAAREQLIRELTYKYLAMHNPDTRELEAFDLENNEY